MNNYSIKVMDEFFHEIEVALVNESYFSALIMTLMLPDICGKAAFPELKDKCRERYIRWIDSENKKSEEQHGCKNEFLDSKIIYDLRCSLIHSLCPDIEAKKKKDNNVDYFELVWKPFDSKNDSSRMSCQYDECNGNIIQVKKRYSISINYLCNMLLSYAKTYYSSNVEKFSFINAEVRDNSFFINNIFGIIKQ